jgi:hypothetical protein
MHALPAAGNFRDVFGNILNSLSLKITVPICVMWTKVIPSPPVTVWAEGLGSGQRSFSFI